MNGLPAPGLFPTVGHLFAFYEWGGGGGACTGTLIGCHTFLTAAHCVYYWDESVLGLVFFQHAGWFAVSSVTMHPSYNDRTLAHDVAVLQLGTDVSAIPPSRINTADTPPAGTAGVIAGFGAVEGISETGSGLLRHGAVELGTCGGSGTLCWAFDAPVGPAGEDSGTCFGDSGGPLFTDPGAGVVVSGVTSAGSAGDGPDPCGPSSDNYDVDVYTEHEWIETTAGTDLDSTTCGTVPQVTDPGSAVHAAQSTTGSSELWSFPVPSGASRLRVSANAEAGQDFALYVRFGAAPVVDPPEYDCASTYGPYPEYCGFGTPQAGTWYALVVAADGTIEYQITASVLGGGGTPTPSPTPTLTVSPSATPTASLTPTVTNTPTASSTPTVTSTPTASPTLGPMVLDIDENLAVGALSDGLLVLRYLFEFRGATLIGGAVGAGCGRCLAPAIEAYLATILTQLDVDGNGTPDPLTDGLLILRYLFEFRGAALVAGAVDVLECTRCDAAEIATYLDMLDG